MSDQLDLKDEIGFQKKEWIAQKVAWSFLTLFLLCGALGLFGEGPLAKGEAKNEFLTIEFERFARNAAPSQLIVSLEKINSEGVSFWISNEFLKNVHLERITPEPDQTELKDNGVSYTYKSTPGRFPQNIIFEYKPEKLGSLHGEIRPQSEVSLAFNQFIYP